MIARGLNVMQWEGMTHETATGRERRQCDVRWHSYKNKITISH